MIIEVREEIDYEEWQRVADQCDYATFFHSPMWSKIFSDTFPHVKVATKTFILEKNTCVVFPMIQMAATGLLQPPTFISNAAYVYGGWICAKQLVTEQHLDIIKWTNENIKNFIWSSNPYDQSLLGVDLSDVGEIKNDFTQCMDTSVGYDAIWRKISRSHRKDIKQAQRKGVTFKIATCIEDWQEYYRVYQDSTKRWGDNANYIYPLRLFENMFRTQSEDIKLYLALVDGKIVSGALVFFHNKHVVGWHGATLKEFFSFHPWHFLMNEITKDVCKGKYRWFDFNPSGSGGNGVVKHKAGFGTQTLPLTRITKHSGGVLTRISRTISKLSRKTLSE